MRYQLVLLNGPRPGARVTLDPTLGPFTIGRDASRDVPLDDHSASRLHARVWSEGEAWKIEDCGSRNGTRVNGKPVQRSEIRPGDLIRIGDRQLVFAASQGESAEHPHPLPPASAATSTVVARVPNPDQRANLLDERHRDAATKPLRSLSLLCRLAGLLHQPTDPRQLAREARQSIAEAVRAERVTILLAGPDGRLRDCHGDAEPPGPEGFLLGALAMQNNEAILTDLGGVQTADARGEAIAAPIPGRGGPRGAIEVYGPAESLGFDQEDLEFVIAVSHQLGLAVENAEHREQLQQNNERLRRRLDEQSRIVGSSPATRELLDRISRVAPTHSTVLVLGESGTGKELVAQTIHELSNRSSGPFLAVNCAAFNESLLESELFGHEAGAFTGADRRRLGQFEQAHLGTIFLDEIGEMSPACQAKLLRILEGHPFERLGGSEPIRVDVRVVAATHRDMREWVEQQRFREDLYYRLRVIELQVPPLRDRGEDALELAALFLDRFRRETGRPPQRLTASAQRAVRNYGWPGNVRELKNAVERAVVLGAGEEITIEDLGLDPRDEEESRLVSLEELELRHIEYVLHAVGGNKTQACKILGIGRGTLYKKLNRSA